MAVTGQHLPGNVSGNVHDSLITGPRPYSVDSDTKVRTDAQAAWRHLRRSRWQRKGDVRIAIGREQSVGVPLNGSVAGASRGYGLRDERRVYRGRATHGRPLERKNDRPVRPAQR